MEAKSVDVKTNEGTEPLNLEPEENTISFRINEGTLPQEMLRIAKDGFYSHHS